jgi:hypothetical protein
LGEQFVKNLSLNIVMRGGMRIRIKRTARKQNPEMLIAPYCHAIGAQAVEKTASPGFFNKNGRKMSSPRRLLRKRVAEMNSATR